MSTTPFFRHCWKIRQVALGHECTEADPANVIGNTTTFSNAQLAERAALKGDRASTQVRRT